MGGGGGGGGGVFMGLEFRDPPGCSFVFCSSTIFLLYFITL